MAWIRVISVDSGSAGEDAGSKKGDIIVKCNQKPVGGLENLRRNFKQFRKNGDRSVKFSVVRDGTNIGVKLDISKPSGLHLENTENLKSLIGSEITDLKNQKNLVYIEKYTFYERSSIFFLSCFFISIISVASGLIWLIATWPDNVGLSRPDDREYIFPIAGLLSCVVNAIIFACIGRGLQAVSLIVDQTAVSAKSRING